MTYPIPQANTPEAIAAVVDAVASGAETDSVIADSIGMVGRQGAYYPNAAAALGYVEPVGKPRVWILTEAGEDFLGLDADERGRDMARRMVSLDDVAAVAGGEAPDWGLAEATTERRRATLDAWVDFALAGSGVRAARVREALQTAAARTPEAVERYRDSLPHEAVLGATAVFTGTRTECREYAAKFPHTSLLVRRSA